MTTDAKRQLLYVRTGGCFCGAVRYQVTGPPLYLCVCHCDSCRRASGGAMVPWGTWPKVRFAVRAGTLSFHESSEGVTRGHCARCGTSISYATTRRADEIDVTLASLGDPTDLSPTAHIWVSDKLPWVILNDGLPQHPGSPPAA